MRWGPHAATLPGTHLGIQRQLELQARQLPDGLVIGLLAQLLGQLAEELGLRG
jgi:hypothetical protein